ncbi:E3 ubiquitin-protein ligase Siah1-like [Centruroides sculpturatus]|uniref:E3 ubiquitin-protein ligase Siah1-like n=1 Tax=Centruroides sculpturatus TaxID=218467 RepID=UPI000C6CED4D|nr:E3 ubiquitin-protein ligase Siah1-like [Centruroides sculpturatus]
MDKSLANLLSCPICVEIVRSPVFQCSNGHIVCSQCKPRITQCHTCREAMGNIRSLVAEQITASLRLLCMHQAHGCPEYLTTEDREFHERQCPFTPFPCPPRDLNCLWEGARSLISPHLQQAHSQINKYNRSSILFLGLDAEGPSPLIWATLLACYGHEFLILVTKTHSEIPHFSIKVYILTKPPSLSSFTYTINLKRGPHSLQWNSTHIPLWESIDTYDLYSPLELSAESIYSFGAFHNFKFIITINVNDTD